MRLINPKKIEHLIKKFFKLSDQFHLKRRANRYFKNSTEKEIRILSQLVDSSKASIDIGVYRGVYSFFLSQLSSYVYAFEANPLLYRRLISSFKNRGNVKIENLAVSSHEGMAKLRIPLRDANAEFDVEQKYQLGTATIHNKNNLDNLEFETINDIKKVTLDKYKFEHEIGFLKIDVEGHEFDVIQGGYNFINTNKPVMLIEIEKRHTGQSHLEIINKIEKFGYECYIVDDDYKLQRFDNSQKATNNNFIFKPINNSHT